ncbi:putative HTH-type transcriptional regulator YybR [Sporomusa sphaeroides DSM 2875]|uniref:HTH-type transcriptional regulator YybR n=3 Tax=Sporomusa TaxID=2375 RepID=A0ABP2C2P7_9FIRM|nr:putative HTH-type transcriptional regulator YybR [Sporomusa sphaeroides DSM 2875]CVK18725.1 putative HTH-type transcriptional regulator YybR [Sporomusa sphaeroides DSM 2875]
MPHTGEKVSDTMSMREQRPINSLKDTPFGYTLSMISGKWKMVILYWLAEAQPIRYNELQRLIGTISHKTLSVQLKELENDGLITREEYPQIPPKVEYSLSEKGLSLYPLMELICQWGEKHKP